MSCANQWIQASFATSDYFHTCGFPNITNISPPFPLPDGEGFVGFLNGLSVGNNRTAQLKTKEYIGVCLSQSLHKGQSHRLEFTMGFIDSTLSPITKLSIYGSESCDNLPFGNQESIFGCPTNGLGWIELGDVEIHPKIGGRGWVTSAINFMTDTRVNAIVIGPECADAIHPGYYFLDKLILENLDSFYLINEIGNPCSDNFLLKIREQPSLTYQWYKNGIALVSETSSQISQMYGDGEYQVRVENQNSCALSKIHEYERPIIRDSIEITICPNEVFTFGANKLNEIGFYIDTFTTIDNCDSTVSLTLIRPEMELDTIGAKIFEGEEYMTTNEQRYRTEGYHKIQLDSDSGCDSIVILKLQYYQVYFPNVFSPNGDGTNDFFQISGTTDLTRITELLIYDQWGNQVFESRGSTKFSSRWDGKLKDRIANTGIYVYVTRIMMEDGKERQFSGTIMLIN